MYQEEITWNLLGNVAHFILTEKHSLYSANSSLVNLLIKIKTTKTLFQVTLKKENKYVKFATYYSNILTVDTGEMVISPLATVSEMLKSMLIL